ncbi:MAG: hypothetical protein H0T79_24430 [Deltaproteobacteria bacterium]|nr:hypothetical protein [Deltaproteobacteria bacterium]
MLFVGVGVVAGLGLAIELWHAGSHDAFVEALLPKLSLSFEGNLPTWCSSTLLFCCALATAAIARAQPGAPGQKHWWGMVVVFAYASLDEAAELHENLGGLFETGGVLYFDWIIPAMGVVAVLAALYLPFVWRLPRAFRNRLIVAGVIYIGGALVMELPLGWWTERAGPDSLGYALIDWVEETLEMVGASLACSALVQHRRDLG